MHHNPKVRTVVMDITPQQALHWLELNTHNRDLRQSRINQYARDMAMGRWVLTHQGIAIADNHVVIDGQHRLWAIVESKKTITMQVTTGLPMKTQEAIDGGIARSARDVYALREGVKVDTLLMGIARVLTRQLLPVEQPSRQEIIDCYSQHHTQIEQAYAMFPRKAKYIRTATVMTVVARSLYTHPAEQVARFVRILANGVRDDECEPQRRDDNALLLRKFLTDNGNTSIWGDIYYKSERALKAYLDQERLKTLYAASTELFPVPGEKQNKVERAAKLAEQRRETAKRMHANKQFTKKHHSGAVHASA